MDKSNNLDLVKIKLLKGLAILQFENKGNGVSKDTLISYVTNLSDEEINHRFEYISKTYGKDSIHQVLFKGIVN